MLNPVCGGARAVARCDELGRPPFSDTADGLFRGYLTSAHAACVEQVGAWMVEAGMDVRLDAAANLIGRYEGAEPGAPALLVGSHLDSVRDAGRYDGPLGVMLGIECVAALHAAGKRMPFAIEVIGFGDEEGSRFPAAMLTSRAMAGVLEPAALAIADAEGVSVGDALAAFLPGVRAGRSRGTGEVGTTASASQAANAVLAARRAASSAIAYLEAHIEQGPVLEAAGRALGTVTGIAAQRRYAVTVSGEAGHAGTTAMPLRRDALAAAAEMVLAAEAHAREAACDLVATVGRLEAAPGAANVIPGRVAFTLDVRAGTDARRDAAADAILAYFGRIAERRGVALACALVHELPASPCDPHLVDLIDAAVAGGGQPPFRLVSGAGHDAMVMAALCPTAMLFIRCRGGISHNPAEHVEAADAEAALAAMLRFIDTVGDDALAAA